MMLNKINLIDSKCFLNELTLKCIKNTIIFNKKITTIALSVLTATTLSATTLKDSNSTTAKTNKCIAPPEVMLSLLMAESAGNRELGYPYIIRINGTQ